MMWSHFFALARALFEKSEIDKRMVPELVGMSLKIARVDSAEHTCIPPRDHATVFDAFTWSRIAPYAAPHGVICFALMLQVHLHIANNPAEDPAVRTFASRRSIPDIVEFMLDHRPRFHVHRLLHVAVHEAIRCLESRGINDDSIPLATDTERAQSIYRKFHVQTK